MDVGTLLEILGAIYLLICVLSVVRCVYSLLVNVKTGWRRVLMMILNGVQVLSHLMFFVILVIRFMFSTRVCLCDFM